MKTRAFHEAIVNKIPQINSPVAMVNTSGDLLFLALPKSTYLALSNAAAKKGKTLAEALSTAINNYLEN